MFAAAEAVVDEQQEVPHAVQPLADDRQQARADEEQKRKMVVLAASADAQRGLLHVGQTPADDRPEAQAVAMEGWPLFVRVEAEAQRNLLPVAPPFVDETLPS